MARTKGPRTFRPQASAPRRHRYARLLPGIAAAALTAFAALFFFFSGRASELIAWRRASSTDFRTDLAEIDRAIVAATSPSEPAAEGLPRLLDAAERSALSVESGLSVLKRRRMLAARFSHFQAPYGEATVRLASRFPHSELVAALAAEALLATGATKSAAPYAARLTEGRFASIAVAVLAAAGALSDPGTLPPDADTMFLAAAAATTDGVASMAFTADAALARLLRGDGRFALAALKENSAIAESTGGRAARLLAELEYDYGDAGKAASLFSKDDSALSALRRADAASLSGDTAEAREAWKTVVSISDDPGIVGIALYDLATTSAPEDAAGHAEERSYLERLLAFDPGHVAGAVRLSRLLPGAEGDAVLVAAGRARSDGLLDLERIRRAADRDGAARTMASLWLLMNARPSDLRIARWAAYYMEIYGAADEVRLVTEAAGRAGSDEPWIDFHEALRAAREGNLDEAERGFSRAATVDGDWRLAADLAVVAEARREMRTALEHYEIASSLAVDRRSRADLQLRVARCLESLGKAREARRVLHYASELDPDNRTVRLELKRLGGR